VEWLEKANVVGMKYVYASKFNRDKSFVERKNQESLKLLTDPGSWLWENIYCNCLSGIFLFIASYCSLSWSPSIAARLCCCLP